jgi:hypothetical protein
MRFTKFTWMRLFGLGLLAILAAPFALMFGYTEYMHRPLESFCSGIPKTATPQQVIALAKQRGFEDASGDEREVWVFNHAQGPMFRFICIAKFQDHKLISNETVDGD